jgi:hypothetical protein
MKKSRALMSSRLVSIAMKLVGPHGNTLEQVEDQERRGLAMGKMMAGKTQGKVVKAGGEFESDRCCRDAPGSGSHQGVSPGKQGRNDLTLHFFMYQNGHAGFLES